MCNLVCCKAALLVAAVGMVLMTSNARNQSNGTPEPRQESSAASSVPEERGPSSTMADSGQAEEGRTPSSAVADSGQAEGLPLQMSGEAAAAPPVAKRIEKVSEMHGDRRVDYYDWLRDKTNPQVIAHLEAENAYTAEVMKPLDALREKLYAEMLGRIQQTDMGVPYRLGGYYYYSRTVEGQQYPIYCRKRGSLEAAEQIILDVNELAKGEKFMSIGALRVSDDGKLLAYSTDNTGFRQYTLQVKNLDSGELLPLRRQRVVNVDWAADNRTLFYTVEEDSTKRPYRLYRHHLGDSGDDALVYEEKDEMFRIGVGRTRSKQYLVMYAGSLTANDVRYLPADTPTGEWKLVEPRSKDHEYDFDHHGEHFYIRTNDRGRNFRMVRAPVADPRRTNWTEVIAHRADVMLENADLFSGHMVLFEREDGLPHLRVREIASGASHRIVFPEPAYSAFPGQNAEFDTATFRYSYQSMVTPNSVFDYDMVKRSSELKKQTEVLGGFDAKQYASERIFATAKDGTRIPISIVYRKTTKRDGAAPLLLYGYGSYGISMSATFSSSVLSLLDRGMIYAIAHIRGGGEMGKPWHDQGRMMNKMTTFTDFIAAAEHLIARKYTSKDRLVIRGGSAGGLLVGAVANLRPDLFKAVVSLVPFVDVLNTMLDASLPLTAGEWEEWGDPRKKEEYAYIRQYCPYTNIARKNYPAILVRTSLNDSQVMYWEPAKYVAKLRTLKTDANPLLFHINMAAGHGGASGRYDALRELAFDYAFVLWQTGLAENAIADEHR
ncbi:MAG TPA: S9 family peptidase, partial [Candidatus Acidoferrales bacterium]